MHTAREKVEAAEAGPGGRHGTASGLLWAFGDRELDVEGVLRTWPELRSRAYTSYLVKHETCDTLPKEHLSTDCALQNIRTLMPGFDFRIEEPRAFARIYRQRTQQDNGDKCDALLSVPHEHDDQWRLLLRSEDPEGLLVSIPLLLEMLGQYALFRAAGIERTPNLDVTLIAGFDQVNDVLSSRGVRTCEHNLIRGASFMAAYALAHFMGLDQRLVTFGLLLASGRNEVMSVLFGEITSGRGDVLAFDNAMRVFLRQRTGATREEWRAAAPADRLRMVSEAAAALLMERPANTPSALATAETAATACGAGRTLH